MKKVLTSWIISLLITTAVHAEVMGGYTFIILTNNTKTNLNLKIHLTTKDIFFKKGRDWDGNTLTLAPYESKQVLWFSRNINVKANQLYEFDIAIQQPWNQPFVFSITEKGKAIYGSDLYSELTLPLQNKQKILTNHHFQLFTADFFGKTYQLYARLWTPTGKLFDNYHFTISEAEISASHLDTPQKLHVLTYNTQFMPFYANVVNNLNHPTIRAQDIPKKISTYDVVILEEVFDQDLRITLTNLMRMYYPYHTKVVGYRTTKALSGGVMIFSKWPILKEDQVVYQASADIDRLAAKGAIYAAINKMGILYHVFGTHLQSANANGGEDAREKQLQELAYFIESLNISHHQAVVIGGDFNIDPLKPQFYFLQQALHVGLPENIGYPYSADSYINTMKVGYSRNRIDYVFYSHLHLKPKLTYNKIFILRDLDNEKMWPAFDLSDHFPVAGFFEFDRVGGDSIKNSNSR